MNTTRFAGLAVLAVSLFLGGCGASMTNGAASVNDGVGMPTVRNAPAQRAIGTAAFHPLAQPNADRL